MTTHETKIRIAQIEQQLAALGTGRRDYNALQNEGATDGYNPCDDQIATLASELTDLNAKLTAAEWTPEVIAERRAWFNAAKFTSPLAALNGCRAKGFEFSDLQVFTAK
tara:strand:- start:203 stop:529 length:327 start_codon:yes stop_codon:yes gene_type:complete